MYIEFLREEEEFVEARNNIMAIAKKVGVTIYGSWYMKIKLSIIYKILYYRADKVNIELLLLSCLWLLFRRFVTTFRIIIYNILYILYILYIFNI